ncbi:hypothetical protein cce_2175 [Crocosphaera subtropica ATCC 51142]|uniref:Ferredoxin--NADP reductase n=1 Tax=Crocosphaera subtropica (strain ATCC 51142 / BH68) TaxID=43989 RepID=B1WNU6_CROS5|nr:FHA domain-containing protein [Crocosphaera subtropica]ACB51525.1 hypothetical protein cce_2175 [Crocosphaera subtropica ATCC 51142]
MLNLKVFNYTIGEFQDKTLTPDQIKREWIIGRATTCDLVLATPEVSRVHGRIGYDQGQYYFSDLGSTDGSRVNHETAMVNQRYALKPDDIIRIGDFVLAVQGMEKNLETTISNHKILETNVASWTQEDLTVKCIRIIEETEDVKTFSFVAEPAISFAYQPGQFVTLNLNIDGKPVKRAYSISSTPTRPHLLEITVKRVPSPPNAPHVPPGLVSNWLHDRLKVGDQIQLSGGPMGKFTCAKDSNPKLLLISAGSGVTPMISMARWLYDTAGKQDVVFVYCGRRCSDIIMAQELQLMAARNPHFHLAISLTQPDPGQPWLGYRGRLSEQMLSTMVSDFRERSVYVCGPDGFMKGVKTLLGNMGLPPENYHEESFGVGKKQAKVTSPVKLQGSGEQGEGEKIEKPSSKPAIAFIESGKTVTCDGQESILEVAQQEGINIRSGCMQGVCGACKKRKRKGNIRYEGEPDGLDQQEQEEGFILPCIAYAVDEIEIEA